MKPRDTPKKQFSSFAQFEDDGFRSWLTDPRLLKNMERQVSQVADAPDAPDSLASALPNDDGPGDGSKHRNSGDRDAKADAPEGVQSDRFWALFWHQTWLRSKSGSPQNPGNKAGQQDSKSAVKTSPNPRLQRLAEQHLVAYLQETCYWVAHDLRRKAPKASASTTLADFFQMAAAELKAALEKFDAQASNNLKAFVAVFLGFKLKSIVRSRQEAGFCSNWGLLRKTSKKRILESLASAGVNGAEAEQYRLLWMGFQELYVGAQPGSSAKLPEPNPEQLEAIAKFYNRQRSSQLSNLAPQLDSAEAATRLTKMARWVRSYCYPAVESLNVKRHDNDGDGIEALDLLSDEERSSVLEDLMLEEVQQARRQHQRQLRELLLEQFQQFDEQTQKILCLLYVQNLPQQAIIEHTQLSQPTISRRLKRARAQLVKALIEQLQDTSVGEGDERQVNNLSDPAQLKSVSENLEACLRIYLRESSLC